MSYFAILKYVQQKINSAWPSEGILQHRSGHPSLVQVMACYLMAQCLTHRGRVTHICVVKLIIIGSDNGLSPGRRQAIIWTNAGILSIGPLGANLIEILIGVQTFLLKKMHLKMSSAKWRPFCLGLNVLRHLGDHYYQHPRHYVTQMI